MELTVVLLALNLFTLMCFWSDKERAIAGARRISEKRLLLLAALGGSPAAYAARQFLRHKTRKQPFSAQLHGIACIQILCILAYLAYRVF